MIWKDKKRHLKTEMKTKEGHIKNQERQKAKARERTNNIQEEENRVKWVPKKQNIN